MRRLDRQRIRYAAVPVIDTVYGTPLVGLNSPSYGRANSPTQDVVNCNSISQI